MNIFILPTDTCYGIWCPIWDSDAYKRIYEIKKRDFSKPLAIMVEDLDWLYENTTLSEQQLDFISEYEKPFTVLTECPRIKMLLEFEDEEISYPNHYQYEQIAFRVAHTPAQKKLIQQEWPIFLTSANISQKQENYKISDIKETFQNYLNEIKIIDEVDLDENISASDIFSFEWESLELNYLRKN